MMLDACVYVRMECLRWNEFENTIFNRATADEHRFLAHIFGMAWRGVRAATTIFAQEIHTSERLHNFAGFSSWAPLWVSDTLILASDSISIRPDIIRFDAVQIYKQLLNRFNSISSLNTTPKGKELHCKRQQAADEWPGWVVPQTFVFCLHRNCANYFRGNSGSQSFT